ncbi:M23 family metallopeptidase [Sorangium sp. So ce1128]
MHQRFDFMAMAIGAAFLGSLAGCASVDESEEAAVPDYFDDAEAENETVAEAAQPITVSGMGHYCSMTWPSGFWAFTWEADEAGQPCSHLIGEHGTGGTIRRAGVYSISGVNNVVARCDGGLSIWVSTGDAPLLNAYNASAADSNCVFTVAPKVMRIFDSPFSSTASVTHATGFDFAQPPYNNLNVSDFGQTGSSTATVVDWKGRDKSTGFVNNHNGHDWLVPAGTPVYAVADGVVRKSRWFNTGCTGSSSPTQGEVYIDHQVTRFPSTYTEKFTSGYFHLNVLSVADGAPVTKGQKIGEVGWVGCSTGSHLHFAVIRMNNTSTDRTETLTIDADGNDGWRNVIEPYGFDPPSGFDPWAWRAISNDAGALSINLWNTGEAPTTGTW